MFLVHCVLLVHDGFSLTELNDRIFHDICTSNLHEYTKTYFKKVKENGQIVGH
jgi:hypothetical protein